MARNADTQRKRELARYVRYLMQDESIRSVARRAGVSHGVLGDLVAERSIPKASTLQKIGQAIGADEVTLLRLGGYLEEVPRQIEDARVIQLARELEALPSDLRTTLLEIFYLILTSFRKATGGRPEHGTTYAFHVGNYGERSRTKENDDAASEEQE